MNLMAVGPVHLLLLCCDSGVLYSTNLMWNYMQKCKYMLCIALKTGALELQKCMRVPVEPRWSLLAELNNSGQSQKCLVLACTSSACSCIPPDDLSSCPCVAKRVLIKKFRILKW